MGRILAIDWGTKRTGIAVSDPLRIIAGGLETVATAQLESWIGSYIEREKVDLIVVGKPLQPNGLPSATLPRIEEFVKRLNRLHPTLKVVMYDERYTSVLAHRAMIEGGMSQQRRRNDKGIVDQISATILLEDFMASVYNV